jgi:integrase
VTGHVQDMWMRTGPNGRKVKGPRHGIGNRWQARWQENGKEKAKRFVSKDAALAHLAHIEVHGPIAPRPHVTFGEYAETWRLSQLHHRAHTIAALDGVFTKMLMPQLGRLPIAGVTRQDVQNAIIEWNTHYAPATVRQAYSYARTVFDTALTDKVIEENPCVNRRMSLPEKTQRKIVPLTPEQVRHITTHIHPHLTAAVTLGAATGLRIGELAGLGPVHLHNGVVSVERQLIDSNHGVPVFGPPKTRKSVREVTTGKVAWEAVQAHLNTYENKHGLVFGTNRGTPLLRNRASSAWHAAAKGLDLPKGVSWHALRHFHASALIARGLSPRAVAERLGHSNVAMTLNIYASLWGTDDAQSTAAIDDILS